MLSATQGKIELTEIQKLVLRLYAKDAKISIREIARKIIKPNKTMIARWIKMFEDEGLITRIGSNRNMRVFVTDKGKEVMK